MERYLSYALDVLKKLISIPTVNPPGEGYEEAASFLKRVLEDLGASVELIEVPEDYLDKHYPYAPAHHGRKRLIVFARFSRSCVLHVNAHYDVVPPGVGWKYEPFTPVIEDGKVFGRGASDDKAGIACAIASLKKLIDEGVEPRVEVAFVPDEESGGIGTRYLVEEIRIKPSRVLITEPTTSERIAIGHKGVVRGFIRIVGTQGHAAAPWRFINAFEEGCKFATKFLSEVKSVFSRYRSSYPYECDEAKFSTISLGGVAKVSTEKENVIPGEFMFSFDARIVPELDVELAKRKILEVAKECSRESRARIEVEITTCIPASVTHPDSDLVKTLVSIAKRVIDVEPRLFVNSGRYDSVYYALRGASCAIYGPGAEGVAHAPNEYVPIEELRRFIAIYSELFKELQ